MRGATRGIVRKILKIDAYEDDSTVVVILTGELDIASAPELEEQAQRLCARPASELVLDSAGSSSSTRLA